MIPVSEAFAPDYQAARANFLQAAKRTGLPVRSYVHGINGINGEPLAIDVVYDGYPEVRQALVISSGTGGIDGLAGSGIQVFTLRDAQLRQRARAAGVALIFVHMVNPYGCSYVSRLDEQGINIQRNFINFGRALPENKPYALLHRHIIPQTWPPTDDDVAVMQVMLKRLGSGVTRVLAAGQYDHPTGMFYGGDRPCWSNTTMQTIFEEHMKSKDKVAWVDLHVTTMGSYGIGERVFCGPEGTDAEYGRAQRWWGQGTHDVLASRFDSSGSVMPHTGSYFNLLNTHCNAGQKTALSIEFGLRPMQEAGQAVRAEQWLRSHPEASRDMQQEIKRDLLNTFYSSREDWQTMLVTQSRDAFLLAIDGLTEQVRPMQKSG